MNEPRISGVGITDFGRFPELSGEALAQAAIRDALADAGVASGEVQAYYCGSAIGALLTGQRALRELNTHGSAVYNIDNACASGATALNLALQALKAGQHDTVVVFGVDHESSLVAGPQDLKQGDWNERRGMDAPALHAMRAMRYMRDHGLTAATLADVAVKNRRHGVLNPIALLCQQATREEVLAAPLVAEPLTLLQCCPSGADGAAALVLTTQPGKGSAAPIRLLASVVLSGVFDTGPVDITRAELSARAARMAYEQSGLGPNELGLVELCDAFTISELLYCEALGLCGPGEAGGLLDSGATALGGRVPVNPSGGLLAKGHLPGATGVAQVVEICQQLQGRAGQRQVEGARIGLAQVAGGFLWGLDEAACAIHILSV